MNSKQKPLESALTFVTNPVTGSYVFVNEARAAVPGAEEKFSMQIIIDKSDDITLTRLDAAVEAAKEKGKAQWGGKIPANLKLPKRDGDVERPDSPEYKGKFFANANTKRKPGIVDKDLNTIIDASEVYSGAKFRVKLTAFPYNVSGSKGVGLSLGNIQKVADGDPLNGSSRNAADDFDVYENETADMLS